MTRARSDPATAAAPQAAAIGRSLTIYRRDADRCDRMTALLNTFLRPGGLMFDIGAHLGDRTAAARRIGARVVALEPQPRVFRALRLLHGRDPAVCLHNVAAGAAPGMLRLQLNPLNPTVATADPGFVAAAATAPGWRQERWTGTVAVPVTTLDRLIAAHGVPDFVKIDVEGFEPRVLAGLGQALPALSFEVTTLQRAAAHACLDRLAELGDYRFAFSLGESHVFAFDGWCHAAEMHDRIAALPDSANSGDVYALRAPAGDRGSMSTA